MLRDPVEQMHSAYYQSILTGDETATSFKKALKLESERKQGRKLPSRRFPSSFLYFQAANFSQQIERYKDQFTEENIKFIFLSDLKKMPSEVYKKTLSFLGLNKTNSTLQFGNKNPGKTPRSIWLNNVLKNPGKPVREAVRRLLPKEVRHSLIDIFDNFMFTKNSRPELDNKLRYALMKKHKKNVERIAEQTGRDVVNLWGYDKINSV